jgi:hypothetical protein
MAFEICRRVLELVYTGSPKMVTAATKHVNKEVWKKPEA